MDYANDMLMATLLASRPSAPDGQERTDVTQMLAGHAEIQLGDYSKLGLSYVNAHNVQTELEFNEGNPLRGRCRPSKIARWTNCGCACATIRRGREMRRPSLADYEIVIEDREGNAYRGREVDLLPKIKGGGNEGGASLRAMRKTLCWSTTCRAFAMKISRRPI